MSRPTVGVLALQGDVREHLAALSALDVTPLAVRRPRELAACDGLVLPGGESTTMAKLARTFEMLDPLRERIAGGLPVLGTCAGMILLADRVRDAAAGQETLGGLDITVRRNAFGRQVDSHETDLDVIGLDRPVHAVFIRAPWVEEVGPGVEVLARVPSGEAVGRIVAVRQGPLLATSFHPEVADDPRIHAMLVALVTSDLILTRSRGMHVRPLQMGDHEAQEGRGRRQAQQAQHQADQEHRGRGADGRP